MNSSNADVHLVKGTLSDPANSAPPKCDLLSGQLDLVKAISDLAIW